MSGGGGTRRVGPRWIAVLAVGVLAAVVVVFGLARGETGSAASPDGGSGSWAEVEAAAQAQTVRLWMWGGDSALNDHIDQDIVPSAAEKGVTVQRVPIESTADAMSRIAADAAAGSSEGSVDLVWVNGANFSQGAEAGLWLKGWTSRVPSLAGVDPSDPTVQTDFGVPVDGQELPWSRAAFVFAYDSARISTPPRDFEQLADYVRAHPGRVTYPAPPDFTGSAFVRQAVQALGEDEAFAMLGELEPMLWKGGATHPQDETELDRLFASGEIDLAMSYNPNFVDAGVRTGRFAADGSSLRVRRRHPAERELRGHPRQCRAPRRGPGGGRPAPLAGGPGRQAGSGRCADRARPGPARRCGPGTVRRADVGLAPRAGVVRPAARGAPRRPR